MSNAELNGSQIPGSGNEKVLCSIEAFYEHNEGRSSGEQWSITPMVIQKLSGSNANRVRAYIQSYPGVKERLEKYNVSYQQNRGKGHPRDSVKWHKSLECMSGSFSRYMRLLQRFHCITKRNRF